MTITRPGGLGRGGAALWASVTAGDHELTAADGVVLLEACRAKDRCDKLAAVLAGDAAVWVRLLEHVDPGARSADVSSALQAANRTADTLKKLLAALRLPDEQGRRSRSNGRRGVYRPSGRVGR